MLTLLILLVALVAHLSMWRTTLMSASGVTVERKEVRRLVYIASVLLCISILLSALKWDDYDVVFGLSLLGAVSSALTIVIIRRYLRPRTNRETN